MKKTARFGFECDTLQNSEAQMIVPVSSQVVLTGFQLDLSLGFLKQESPVSTLIGKDAPFSMVLFTFGWAVTAPEGWLTTMAPAEFGAPIYHQVAGTNPVSIHGDPILSSQFFVSSIIKSFDQSAQNKTIVMNNLCISIPSGYLVMQVGHSGYPADFECQGILFYN